MKPYTPNKKIVDFTCKCGAKARDVVDMNCKPPKGWCSACGKTTAFDKGEFTVIEPLKDKVAFSEPEIEESE